MTDSVELLQFPYSHFNEKARWALDFKGITHERTNLLPGPHAITASRLSGQQMVPIVRFGDDVVHNSSDIIAELERRYPDPPLYPDDRAERDKAFEIQRYFDNEIGPMVRRGIFAVFTQEPDYLVTVFGEGHSPLKQRVYRLTIPVVSAVMKKSMGLAGDDSIREAIASTQAGLDFVAREAGPEGFLVGNRFSVADLAAAALLAPTTGPPDSTMCLPEPRPERIQVWFGKWSDHPGTQWVRDMYSRFRKPA